MANPRKVQQEIDKLLKKVQEGMEVYEATFEKVNSAPDREQKVKFEAELKKEIKKLQRLREQIKVLHANPEVKNKGQLETTRRAIEVKMEGFKVCERETKTKAFSKEGLAAMKMDPAARAKAKTCGWINNAIQELQDQIEQLEFDIEKEDGAAAAAPSKKKKGGGDEREERMKRNNYHILKLESILRVLEMGELEPEDVDEIEPEVQAFVEGFQDPNFEEDENMDIYELFDIPEGMVQAIGATKDGETDDDSSENEDGSAKAKPAEKAEAPKTKDTPPVKAPAAKPAAKKAPVEPAPKKAPSPSVPVKAAAPAAIPIAAPKTPLTPATAAKGPTTPGTGGAKSMAAMLAGHRDADKKKEEQLAAAKAPVPAPAAASGAGGPGDLLDEDDDNNDDTFGDDALEGVTPGGAGTLADLASMTAAAAKVGGDWAKPLPAAVAGTHQAQHGAQGALASAPKLPPASPLQASKAPAQPQPTPAPTAAKQPAPAPAAPSSAPAASTSSSSPAAAAAAPPAVSPSGAAAAASPAPAPVMKGPSSEVIQNMLKVSLRNLPHTSDCERPKPYTPPNPYQTPDYYPQTVHPAFNSPETFTHFETDTLFFIFYYQQSSYQQYLAAKELKRQSWRFHKKYQTWFQRHDRPKVTNDEFEQGTYIYFDYEGGWCPRIKADFVFKYSQLEDTLV